MKYYVTAEICGVIDEDGTFDTLEEALATRDKWNKEAEEEGHAPGFWIVSDQDGNRYE